MTDLPAAEVADPSSDQLSGDSGHRWLWCPLIVFVVALVVVFLRTPWPGTTIGDSDAGHQLAGAQQIAAGEHPFADFRSTYGPLTFYVSFVGQWLSGGRLAGELLICTFAYAFVYTLIFSMLSWITNGRHAISIAITVLAIVQLPRFYKYYILLGPGLSLFCFLWYLARPNAWRRLLAAAGVVIAGLYRPDMGAYAALAGLIAMGLARDNWNSRLHDMFQFGLLILLVASPWLVFVSTRHHFWDYIHDSTLGSASQAQGLSLPFPRPHADLAWNAPPNLEAYAFLIWWGLPIAGVLVIATRWRKMDDLLRRRAVVTLVLATLCLMQSAHRSEYHHLMQALGPSYVLAGFVVFELMRSFGRPPVRAGIACVAVILGGVSICAGMANHALAGGSTKAFPSYYRFYLQDRATFVRQMSIEHPDNVYVRLIQYIDATTKPGDRILAVPFMPMLYYLSERRFAGQQMLIAPGYFSGRNDEYRLVRQLKADGNPMIIESVEGGAFDGLATREIKSYSPVFYAYLVDTYEPVVDPSVPTGFRVWRAKGGAR